MVEAGLLWNVHVDPKFDVVRDDDPDVAVTEKSVDKDVVGPLAPMTDMLHVTNWPLRKGELQERTEAVVANP